MVADVLLSIGVFLLLVLLLGGVVVGWQYHWLIGVTLLFVWLGFAASWVELVRNDIRYWRTGRYW